MSNPEFRVVESLFGLYEISEYGVLRRVRDGKIVREGFYGRGYLGALLRDKGLVNHPNAFYVRGDARPHVHVKFHILVAEAFIGKRPDNFVIDHIDHNISNNHYSNLRYCSVSDNWHNMGNEAMARVRCSSSKNARRMSELNQANGNLAQSKSCILVDEFGNCFSFSKMKDAFEFVVSKGGTLKTVGSVSNKLRRGELANGFKLQNGGSPQVR